MQENDLCAEKLSHPNLTEIQKNRFQNLLELLDQELDQVLERRRSS